jgi:transcriptional regulator
MTVGGSMYLPKNFEEQDIQKLLPIMQEFPFATLVTVNGGQPFLNHLPLTAELNATGELELSGHMSRRNPQWGHFESSGNVTVSFHGPQTYINPNWYKENDVPTWNYIAIHVVGKATLVEDYDGILHLLAKSTNQMNRLYEEKWSFLIPDDLKSEADLTSAIVGFKIDVVKAVGKFKLSQNRSREDVLGVIEGLKSRNDDNSRGICRFMMGR